MYAESHRAASVGAGEHAKAASEAREKVMALQREVDAAEAAVQFEKIENSSRSSELQALKEQLDAVKRELAARVEELSHVQTTMHELDPTLDALADTVEQLEKENNVLASRLGETRSRGRVDVRELLVRAALLKRREARNRQEA